MIDGRSSFDQPVENNLRTCDNIRKIVTRQGDDYISVCLQDYHYFKKYYILIAIDLRKRQMLDADPKAIQQINSAGNLEKSFCSNVFRY